MKRIKYLYLVIILICIFNLIISFSLIWRNRIVLNLNNDNRSIVLEILEEYTNTNSVKKVAYGREWTHGFIYVYRPFNKAEALLISEGEQSKGDLAEFIQKNGYKEANIGKILGILSLIFLIFTIIILKIKNKKTSKI